MARTKLPQLPPNIGKPDQPRIIGSPTTFPKTTDSVEPVGGDGQPLAPLVPSTDGLIVKGRGWPGSPMRKLSQPANDEPTETVQPPAPKKYKVVKGGQFYNSGTPAMMRSGKVIDDVQYNVESLLKQGIELEALP